MFCLSVTMAGELIERHEFEQDRVVIGRAAAADLQIGNLGISRAHCEIWQEGPVYRLRDLRSDNGTYVDGRKISTYNLNDGDEIAIGKFIVVFNQVGGSEEPILENDLCNSIPRTGSSYTVMVEGSTATERTSRIKGFLLLPLKRGQKQEAIVLDKSMAAIGSGRRRDITITGRTIKLKRGIKVRDKSGLLRETYVLDKPLVVIGSGPRCDITISGWFVKHKHAIIVRDKMGFILMAIGKTFLKNKQIDQTRMHHGDHIRIRNHRFQFMAGRPVA